MKILKLSLISLLLMFSSSVLAQGISPSSKENIAFFERVKNELSLTPAEVLKAEKIFNASNKKVNYQFMLTQDYKTLEEAQKLYYQINLLEEQVGADINSYQEMKNVIDANRLSALKNLIADKANETELRIKQLKAKIDTNN